VITLTHGFSPFISGFFPFLKPAFWDWGARTWLKVIDVEAINRRAGGV